MARRVRAIVAFAVLASCSLAVLLPFFRFGGVAPPPSPSLPLLGATPQLASFHAQGQGGCTKCTILKADYWGQDFGFFHKRCFGDVTEVIKHLWDSGARSFKVSTEALGGKDPCPNEQKTLRITTYRDNWWLYGHDEPEEHEGNTVTVRGCCS